MEIRYLILIPRYHLLPQLEVQEATKISTRSKWTVKICIHVLIRVVYLNIRVVFPYFWRFPVAISSIPTVQQIGTYLIPTQPRCSSAIDSNWRYNVRLYSRLRLWLIRAHVHLRNLRSQQLRPGDGRRPLRPRRAQRRARRAALTTRPRRSL